MRQLDDGATPRILPGGFGRWLRNQRKRDDPIGDLARDFLSLREGVRTPHGLWMQLRRYNACEQVHEVLNEAVEEYGGPEMLAALHRKVEASHRLPREPGHSRRVVPSLRALVLARDNFRCRRCGAEPQHARLVMDHITPVALGGRTVERNLQTLCDPCNQGKGDRPPHAHDLLP